MKTIITGSNGFIGKNLHVHLLEFGYTVIPVEHEHLKNKDTLKKIFTLHNPDFILHLAAYGNKYSQKNDSECIQANILNLFNLLEASREIEYKGFVNFSSSSVMLDYVTMYSATKESGERIVAAFVNKYDKPIVNIRPFTVIGRGEPKEHLIPKLIDSCLNGTEMPFVGEPVHDFIGINDFCNDILLILNNIDLVKGRTVDIGNSNQIDNETVLEIVEELTGKKANIKRVNSLRSYDNQNWSAMTSDMHQLGSKHTESLVDVIRGML